MCALRSPKCRDFWIQLGKIEPVHQRDEIVKAESWATVYAAEAQFVSLLNSEVKLGLNVCRKSFTPSILHLIRHLCEQKFLLFSQFQPKRFSLHFPESTQHSFFYFHFGTTTKDVKWNSKEGLMRRCRTKEEEEDMYRKGWMFHLVFSDVGAEVAGSVWTPASVEWRFWPWK